MTEPKLNLATFLVNEMSKRNISFTKLSSEVKVPKTCLHSWSNGVSLKLNEKNLEYLSRLAKYFDTSIAKLLIQTNSNEKSSNIILETTFRDGSHTFRLKIEKISD